MQVEKDGVVSLITGFAGECGCKVYVVGGWVRDWILGREPSDLDFVVFGDIDALAMKVAKHYNCPWMLYEKKLKTYRIFAPGGTLDLSLPRGESIEEDLKYRDITINAMAYDPTSGDLIDPLGGVEDAERRVVRVASEHSLVDDPVRVLRVFRFAAMFRFSVDGKTLLEVKRVAHMLNESAGERITEELKKFFLIDVTFPYLIMMDNTGVLEVLFCEMRDMAGCIQSSKHLYDVKTHSLNVYNFVEWYLERLPRVLGECYGEYMKYFAPNREKVIVAMKLAALLHDAGKPRAKVIDGEGLVHFPGHEGYGAEILDRYRARYSFGNDVYDLSSFLIINHVEPANIYLKWKDGSLSKEDVVDFFFDKHVRGIDLLLFSLADTLAKGKVSRVGKERSMEFLRFMCREYFGFFKPAFEERNLVNGYDIIGNIEVDKRKIGYLLREAKRAQILGLVKTKEEALSYLRGLIL